MVKVDIDDAILLLVVKRKVNPETNKDTVMIMTPTNQQDAIRIMQALTIAQKTLAELTKRALMTSSFAGAKIDGAKKAENLQ